MAQTKKAQEKNNKENQVDLQESEQTQTPPSRQAGANQPEHPQYLRRNEQSEQNRGLMSGGQFAPTNPFSMLRRFSEDLNRFFGGNFNQLMANDFSPQTEIFERGNELVIHADLPGMSKDDINVNIENDQIVIRGERRNEREHNTEGVYHSERSYGSFYRSIPLPEGIDSEKAKASFNNGVLEITMPKPEQKTGGRRIEISEGNQTKNQSGQTKQNFGE